MEFRILGPLELVASGRPIDVSGRRQRALLALLVLHANEVVSSDRLIEGLWGEQPPATAAKALQNAVSQLRRSLGDDLIVTRAPGYQLRVAPDAIDARRFEALLDEGRQALGSGDPGRAAAILGEALALWRGPPLDEFSYEPFAETEIGGLEELRLRALEERIEADLALGRHGDLVGELERLVAEHPLRERPRGQLMLALYRSGRQAEALRAYEDGRRRLAEELGLEPGAALQRLEKQILIHDPALDSPPTVPLPSAGEPDESATVSVGRPHRRRLAAAPVAIALAIAALVAAFLLARSEDAAPTAVPNSLVKINPETGEIVDVFRVGGDPLKPAIVGDYVFVSSEEAETLSRVDVHSAAVDTFGGLTSPAAVAAGTEGTLWVGSAEGSHVSQINSDDFHLLQSIEIPEGSGSRFLAVGGGSVWVSHRPAALSRFNPRTGQLRQRYPHPIRGEFLYSAEVAFGEGAAWNAANGIARSNLLRIDALGGGSQAIDVGEIPYAVTVGFGAVWLSDLVHPPVAEAEAEAGLVLRVDPASAKLEAVIAVGKRPAGVATGGGSVWVANGGETTISEIDPRTNEVVKTIDTGHYPHSLVYGHGYLWVSLHAEPFSF